MHSSRFDLRTTMAEELIEAFRSLFSILFLSSAAAVALLAALLRGFRSLPWWCGCPVCDAYVTGSWASHFPNLCDWYTHLLRESPTRTIHIHVLRNTITADPANVEYMLRARFNNYPKGKPFAAILGDLLGRGIFNADGPIWSFQRKLAAAELDTTSVRLFASRTVSAEVHSRLLPLLDLACAGDVILDLQDVFRRFAFDTICKISFGLDPGCLELPLPASEFAAAFDAATRLSAMRATTTMPWIWKAKRLVNWGSERELREAIGLVNLLAKEVIHQRRKLGFANDHDLLSRFMASVEDDEFLRDIIISFLLAGRDTVASALTGFFLLLSRHANVRSAIRDLVDGNCDYDHLRGSHYLQAAIYESMRLLPPVQFDSKFCLDDDVLPDGALVGKGTRVTYHAYAMGRMEELWGSDCAEFRPRRWLNEDGVFVPQSPYKYPVFHGGLRACIGKEMALMEMVIVIAAVVRRYNIDVVGDDVGRIWPPKFAPGLTASLKEGLRVRVRQREDAK